MAHLWGGMPKFIDLTGKRFGRYAVVDRHVAHLWNCVCDCGAKRVVNGSSLRLGFSLSCGCLRREVFNKTLAGSRATHGMSHHPEYRVWASMRDRCNNPNTANYPQYGGRGVKVCDRWNDYSLFIADMGRRPAGHSLDRIDNNGNYEPTNCRWATRQEQNRNTRRNKTLAHNGDVRCIAEWADKTGIHEAIIRQRLALGWDVDRALTEPVKSLARRFLTHDGKTQSISAWCNELGLPFATTRNRIHLGWADSAVLTTPVRPKKPKQTP